jgi:hypothetical protein
VQTHVIMFPGHRSKADDGEHRDDRLAAAPRRRPAERDEKIGSYPEIDRFGKPFRRACALARHVKGLTINLKPNVEPPELRPAVVCVDGADVNHQLPFPRLRVESLVRLESAASGKAGWVRIERTQSAAG